MSEGYATDSRYTVEAYFDLVKRGLLDEDDRVELLEGVIVAEPPMDPSHACGIGLVAEALRTVSAGRALLRVQAPFLATAYSAPEPDVAVVPGGPRDYWDRHPTSALLVVEVSNTSLKQDRLSKSRIYAAAAIPEYWIVNLRDDCVEVFRSPDRARRVYVERHTVRRGERLTPVAFSDASIAVGAVLPPTRLRVDD
jgi:Uma2 family endonuclease